MDFSITHLLNAGGSVTWAILGLCFLLWLLMLERLIYIKFEFPKQAGVWHKEWQERADHSSWNARQIRQAKLYDAHHLLHNNMPIIKVLVALCPLLGLLGTVTGMVSVFDVMAYVGTGNARAMASGISQATIPTMAGMLVAVTGLYFSARLQSMIKQSKHFFADSLGLVH